MLRDMQKISQNNKEYRICNFKAIFITEQVTAPVRKVTFVSTQSFVVLVCFKSLFS